MATITCIFGGLAALGYWGTRDMPGETRTTRAKFGVRFAGIILALVIGWLILASLTGASACPGAPYNDCQ